MGPSFFCVLLLSSEVPHRSLRTLTTLQRALKSSECVRTSFLRKSELKECPKVHLYCAASNICSRFNANSFREKGLTFRFIPFSSSLKKPFSSIVSRDRVSRLFFTPRVVFRAAPKRKMGHSPENERSTNKTRNPISPK